MFICLTSIGLPGLNGFVGEVLVLMGMFDFQRPQRQRPVLAVVGTAGIVLGAWYMLTHAAARVLRPGQGAARTRGTARSATSTAASWPPWCRSRVLCLFIGVYPQPFLDTARAATWTWSAGIAERRQRSGSRGQRHGEDRPDGGRCRAATENRGD